MSIAPAGSTQAPSRAGSCLRERATFWRDALESWAIPSYILDRSPRSPWEFPPALFARVADRAINRLEPNVTYNRILEELEPGASVLDVGVGAGAGSLQMGDRPGLVIGVDDLPAMLDRFAEKADSLGVAHQEVLGRWPGIAPMVAPADLVVCTHVLYNVPDLVPFIESLTDHARCRVVVEMTGEHPTSIYNPLWLAVHGIERPTSPTAEDALALIEAMGLPVRWEQFENQWTGPGGGRDTVVAYVCQRLCLGPDRAGEIDALLGPDLPEHSRRVVTAWWPGRA